MLVKSQKVSTFFFFKEACDALSGQLRGETAAAGILFSFKVRGMPVV